MGKEIVLITGVSSGIGKAVARLLAGGEFVVFGTSRDPSGSGDIPGVKLLPLDVRSNESVRACVHAVLDQSGQLDVLINNAGYALAGAVEEASLEEAKEQFETNFFGIARMVKAVLPVMRRQGKGRIINIGSLAGLSPVPFLGFYSASKHALEGYSEALRQEVKPFNIHVSLVEPGFIRTGLGKNSRNPVDRIGEYDPWRGRAMDSITRYIDDAPEPASVAEWVVRVLESQTPKTRYKVGKEANQVIRLRRLLPESLFEKLIRAHFRMDFGRENQ
jgi:NAD(P)-dependent dehydrogenase (short-subunit alcohol dehydrogenase family)